MRFICITLLKTMDMDRFDPNWQAAQHHGRSCYPGRPVHRLHPTENDESYLLCECCLNVVDKEPISLCENSKELEFLGFGFPLYFIFLKYVLVLLFLLMISYSSLEIYWAAQANFDFCYKGVSKFVDGHVVTCSSWMIEFSSTQEIVTDYEVILRTVSFIIQLFALIYIRDILRKTYEYYDERTTSLSDYAFLIQNLPPQKGIQKKLKIFFSEFFSKKYLTEEIVLLNEIEGFDELEERKKKLIEEKRHILSQTEKGVPLQKQLKAVSAEIEEVKRLIDLEYDKEKTLTANDEVECEKAFIVAESEQCKEAILQEFEKCNKELLANYFGPNANLITLSEAPEPKEVIWQNVNYPRKKKIFRLFLGWILAAVFLTIVTVIFYFILQAKGLQIESAIEEANNNPEEASHLIQQATTLAYLVILLIIIFNKFILAMVMHKFTDLEKHGTTSDYESSFRLKYTLGLFFTTAVMTLIVEDIRFHNINHQSFGVVEEESIMFFMNSFLVPFIWIVNPWSLFRSLQRKIKQGRANMTQQEANLLMEDSHFSIGKKYAEVIECAWFTFLYASLIPGGAFLIFIGTCLFYWVDKFNLLRRSSVCENVSGHISQSAMRLLDFTLVLRPLGQIIFDAQLRGGVQTASIVTLCVGLAFFIIPKGDILDYFHEEKFKMEEKTFKQAKSQFVETYHTLHPLFARERKNMILGMGMAGKTLHFLEAKMQGSLNATMEQLLKVNPKGEIFPQNVVAIPFP